MISDDPILDKAWANMRAAEMRLAWETPFHGHNLAMMHMGPNPSIPTMRIGKVNGAIKIEFSPEFTADLTIRQAAAVLKHEIHHLVFGHLCHSREAFPNSMARTIAEEVSVNEWIDASDLPGQPVLLEHFPELKPGQSFEERYRILSSMNFESDPRVARLEDEAEIREASSPTISSSDVARMAGAAVADLGAEKASKGMPGGKQQAILRGMSHGTEAGGLASLVQATSGKPVVPWAARLRRFLGADSGKVVPTYSRPSRRHLALAGLVPGRETKPQNPRVMLAVDSSGSMTDSVLAEIHREILGIIPHAEVWLVQFDTIVQEVRRLSPSEIVKGLVFRGRGGTDFRPPLSHKLIQRIKPAWVILFTDGHGVAPPEPPKCRLAWVLCGFRPQAPASYGEIIPLAAAPVTAAK